MNSVVLLCRTNVLPIMLRRMQMSVYTADDENLAHLRDGFTNAINRDGYSPLTLAASLGSVVCVETVIVESG